MGPYTINIAKSCDYKTSAIIINPRYSTCSKQRLASKSPLPVDAISIMKYEQLPPGIPASPSRLYSWSKYAAKVKFCADALLFVDLIDVTNDLIRN